MEPKSISFSAGAAVLVYYFGFPDAAAQLGTTSAGETVAVSGILLSALTAVITPFAAVGKAALGRLTDRIAIGPLVGQAKDPEVAP